MVMDVIIHELYSPPVDDLWCNMNSVESNLPATDFHSNYKGSK